MYLQHSSNFCANGFLLFRLRVSKLVAYAIISRIQRTFSSLLCYLIRIISIGVCSQACKHAGVSLIIIPSLTKVRFMQFLMLLFLYIFFYGLPTFSVIFKAEYIFLIYERILHQQLFENNKYISSDKSVSI